MSTGKEWRLLCKHSTDWSLGYGDASVVKVKLISGKRDVHFLCHASTFPCEQYRRLPVFTVRWGWGFHEFDTEKCSLANVVENLVSASWEICCCIGACHAGCQAHSTTSFDSSHSLNRLWAAPPCVGTLLWARSVRVNQGGGRGMKCLLFLCQVNFLKHWTAGLNISKQQIVWDQSAALGFITQISSVTVPKQKVWLAWEEHPYEIWALLWNESGCMGENREYRVQNLSCCAFHMMKFPLLKRPEPKQKEGAEGTENFCGRTVLHVLFYVMKWIQLYPADCN